MSDATLDNSRFVYSFDAIDYAYFPVFANERQLVLKERREDVTIAHEFSFTYVLIEIPFQ